MKVSHLLLLLLVAGVSSVLAFVERHETVKTVTVDEVTYEDDDDDDDDDNDVTSNKDTWTTLTASSGSSKSETEVDVKELKVVVERNQLKMREMYNNIEQQEKRIQSLSKQVSVLAYQMSAFSNYTKSALKNVSVTQSASKVEVPRLGGGVSYIRWGRTKCQGDSAPLYAGYAVTSRWNETGGGSDILCLHNSPPTPAIKTSGYGSRLFGVEYDFAGSPFSTINNKNQSLYYNDMPCALCHTQQRNDQVMVPGKNVCPVGWVREYMGFMVSSWYKNTKSSFYCLDSAPEVIPGGQARADTAYAHPVDIHCGPLPCSVFGNGDRVACVVCSK